MYIGPPGGVKRETMRIILDAFGWSGDDIEGISELKAPDAAEALCDNGIDAFIYTIGHPNPVVEQAVATCRAVLAPVAGRVIDTLVANSPIYVRAVIPKGTYRGQSRDISTIGLVATVVTTTRTKPEVVYQVTKAFFENLDRPPRRVPIVLVLDHPGNGLERPNGSPARGCFEVFCRGRTEVRQYNRSYCMNKNLRLGLVGWAMSIVVALVAVPAAADPDDLDAILGAIDDPHPLRAADTSSPRDTLRSFIRDFSEGIQAWQKDEPEAAIYRPLYRASETFDATELAAIDRLASGALKMAFLREILDRIELPSFEQIPGDEEVAETGITRWTLPNTNIEIVKIEDGPNAGQFLFSNQTVEQLENYYEMAKACHTRKGHFLICTKTFCRVRGGGCRELCRIDFQIGPVKSPSVRPCGNGSPPRFP